MDVQFIETLLDLPEFRVIGHLIGPRELELYLVRRASYLVCPHCQGCCSRVKEGRDRCLRDLPILDRLVTLRLQIRRFECADCHHRPWEKGETFGDRVKWTQRLYQQVRQEFLHGCPCKELARRYGLSTRTVFRWTFEKRRGARPRKLGRVLGIDEYSRRKGHRYHTIVVDLEKGRPITTFKGRRVDNVVKWFKSRPQQELDQVDVMSEDSHWWSWIGRSPFIQRSRRSLAIRFK
jgi:transposase